MKIGPPLPGSVALLATALIALCMVPSVVTAQTDLQNARTAPSDFSTTLDHLNTMGRAAHVGSVVVDAGPSDFSTYLDRLNAMGRAAHVGSVVVDAGPSDFATHLDRLNAASRNAEVFRRAAEATLDASPRAR